MKALEIRIEEAPCHELTIPAALGAARSPAAQAPGGVRRYADGAAVLHMAPGRWLLVGAAISWESATLVTAQAHGGSLIDVSGKWLRLSVTGAEAHDHLSRFLNLTQLLRDRDCAPVSILDCPTLLARYDGGFELWVTRSWAKWLHESLIAAAGNRLSAREAPGDTGS
jgi:sarcosine oxidase gamma subunit